MRHIKAFIAVLAYFFVLASCSPFPREKERMAAAMEQAESIYGDGNLMIETDTVLFIPGLSDASAYYARKKQFGKAALAALYNGYAEKDYDKEMAMNSFKDAERYGGLDEEIRRSVCRAAVCVERPSERKKDANSRQLPAVLEDA